MWGAPAAAQALCELWRLWKVVEAANLADATRAGKPTAAEGSAHDDRENRVSQKLHPEVTLLAKGEEIPVPHQ